VVPAVAVPHHRDQAEQAHQIRGKVVVRAALVLALLVRAVVVVHLRQVLLVQHQLVVMAELAYPVVSLAPQLEGLAVVVAVLLMTTMLERQPMVAEVQLFAIMETQEQ
jgi:hypothetical protein